MAANATFALKAGVWVRRVRLLIVSPNRRAQRARCQAETPPIVLSRFPRPALTDPRSSILIGAFAHNLGPHKSVAELLSKTPKKVEGLCRVLEQIGLVTPDEVYPFGFKPTAILEDIVRRRAFRPLRNSKKEEPTLEEEEFLLSIFDAALLLKSGVLCVRSPISVEYSGWSYIPNAVTKFRLLNCVCL